MTLHFSDQPKQTFQRARGALSISATSEHGQASRLQNLRQEGSYRAIFPRPSTPKLEAVAINTSGGVTGGDIFSIEMTAQENAQIALTPQAAERFYRAPDGNAGQITNRLNIGRNAQLYWLPQETILFDGCNIRRQLNVEVDPSGSALILEPLVFGREASGETIRSCQFHDCVSITSKDELFYFDRIQLTGDLASSLVRGAVAGGARAMASIILVDANAALMLGPCRALLPATAGASMLSDTVLVMRILARDGFALREALLPLLECLTHNNVPKNWRL